MKVFTVADIPDALAKAWLQHLRDFDDAHPGCHFEIVGDAPDMPSERMIDALRIDPGFPFVRVFKR